MKKQDINDELELISINENGKDEVQIPRTNDRYKVGWLCQRTQEKLSLLELNSGIQVTSENSADNVKKRAKMLAKASSYIILNGIKIFFFHWFLWRYFYYIKGYTSDQLVPIISIGKKKALLMESYLGSVLVAQMKITNPILTKEEAEQLQAKLGSV